MTMDGDVDVVNAGNCICKKSDEVAIFVWREVPDGVWNVDDCGSGFDGGGEYFD